MFRLHRGFLIELDVLEHGIAAVGGSTKDDAIPKAKHLGEMGFPVDLNHLRKKMPDAGIKGCFLVKGPDQQLDIRKLAQVFFHDPCVFRQRPGVFSFAQGAA